MNYYALNSYSWVITKILSYQCHFIYNKCYLFNQILFVAQYPASQLPFTGAQYPPQSPSSSAQYVPQAPASSNQHTPNILIPGRQFPSQTALSGDSGQYSPQSPAPGLIGQYAGGQQTTGGQYTSQLPSTGTQYIPQIPNTSQYGHQPSVNSQLPSGIVSPGNIFTIFIH